MICREEGSLASRILGLINWQKPVLAAPDNQGRLLHRSHCSLYFRDLIAREAAQTDEASKRLQKSCLSARKTGKRIFIFDQFIRHEFGVMDSELHSIRNPFRLGRVMSSPSNGTVGRRMLMWVS